MTRRVTEKVVAANVSACPHRLYIDDRGWTAQAQSYQVRGEPRVHWVICTGSRDTEGGGGCRCAGEDTFSAETAERRSAWVEHYRRAEREKATTNPAKKD